MNTDQASMNPEEETPSRLQRIATLIEDGLLTIILSSMIVLAASQIVSRNLFDESLFWGDPLLRVMVLWVGLLGAIVASRKKRHITIDIISRYLPGRAKCLSRLITDLFTAMICAFVAYHCLRFVQMDMEAETYAFSIVPSWLVEIIMPLGFVLMALFYLGSSFGGMVVLIRNKQ